MVKLKVQFLSSPPIDFEWNKESLKETIEKLLAKFNFHGGASDFVLQNDATKQTLTEQVSLHPTAPFTTHLRRSHGEPLLTTPLPLSVCPLFSTVVSLHIM